MLIYLLEWKKAGMGWNHNFKVSVMTAINKILIYLKMLLRRYRFAREMINKHLYRYAASREILHYFYDFNFNEERVEKSVRCDISDGIQSHIYAIRVFQLGIKFKKKPVTSRLVRHIKFLIGL